MCFNDLSINRKGVMTGKKILVVDDGEDFLKIVGRILERSGYSVVKARRGEEAVELSKAEMPDLILLDINLPGLDGTQAGAIIKSTPKTKDIPIIYLTGLLSKGEESELESTLAGNFFLAKPCNPKELLEAIEKRI
jgi:CheY-like chemotaxis protein